MAKKFVLVCDVCDEDATDAVSIKFNNYGSKLDVCPDHLKTVTADLVAIMEHGMETGTKPGTKKPKAKKATAPTVIDPEQSKKIREWAVSQGLNVNPRGKIRQDILDAYNDAH